jgi:hypothetical protein
VTRYPQQPLPSPQQEPSPQHPVRVVERDNNIAMMNANMEISFDGARLGTPHAVN